MVSVDVKQHWTSVWLDPLSIALHGWLGVKKQVPPAWLYFVFLNVWPAASTASCLTQLFFCLALLHRPWTSWISRARQVWHDRSIAFISALLYFVFLNAWPVASTVSCLTQTFYCSALLHRALTSWISRARLVWCSAEALLLFLRCRKLWYPMWIQQLAGFYLWRYIDALYNAFYNTCWWLECC